MNQPVVPKSPALPASIIDLIDDALQVVSGQQARKLLRLLDELHRLLVDTEVACDRPLVFALRAAAQRLSEASGYFGFHAGLDLAYAVESLTSRLIVNARSSREEWRRVMAMEEHCFALLGPRRVAAPAARRP